MPTLTGLDPNAATPGHYREFVWAQGASSGGGSSLPITIFANKTSAGSEVVDTLGAPVGDNDDCVLRFGRRSEAHRLYRTYASIDPGAEINIIAVTESAGNASTATITFLNAATDSTTGTCSILGETATYSITSGDTAINIAAALAAAVNAADGGNWEVTAANSGTAVCTFTTSNKGPRTQVILDSLRVTHAKDVATTITKSAVVAGTTEDDGTAAFAAAVTRADGIWVIPWYSASTVSATDNQIGEAAANIKTQALPINGNQMHLVFGVRGTQANSTTTCTDTDINSARIRCFWTEDNDWTPGMVAAMGAAVLRSEFIAYPAANINGYTTTDTRKLPIADPYDKTDRPTAVEIEACLRNGVTAIAFRGNGSAYIPRHVTTRSLNDQGTSDFRTREGHISFALDFAWADFKTRLLSQVQPNVANNAAEGQTPSPLTTTPNDVKAIAFAMIDDLAGPNPQGRYPGPILAPDKIQEMKDSVQVTKSPGQIGVRMGLFATEHLISTRTKLNQLGAAY